MSDKELKSNIFFLLYSGIIYNVSGVYELWIED